MAFRWQVALRCPKAWRYGHFVPGMSFCETIARSSTLTTPSWLTSALALKPGCPVRVPKAAFTRPISAQLILPSPLTSPGICGTCVVASAVVLFSWLPALSCAML